MMRLSRSLSLFTTRNSISPLRSSMTAGYREEKKESVTGVVVVVATSVVAMRRAVKTAGAGQKRDVGNAYLLGERNSRDLNRLLLLRFDGLIVVFYALAGGGRRRVVRRLALAICVRNGQLVREYHKTGSFRR